MKKYLLGFSKEKEVVFGEIDVNNGVLTASFDTVAPFLNEEIDGIEYFEQLLDECFSDDQKYELCVKYNCAPSELAEALADDPSESVDSLADERDCSIYSDRINVDGNEWAFESSNGGQYDFLKDGMLEFVDESAVKELYALWKEYHLKKVDDTIVEKVARLQAKLDIGICREEAMIASYIKKYCE